MDDLPAEMMNQVLAGKRNEFFNAIPWELPAFGRSIRTELYLRSEGVDTLDRVYIDSP